MTRMNNKKVFVISLFLVAYFVKALVCHVMYVCIADEQKNKITHEPYATFLLIFFPKVKTKKRILLSDLVSCYFLLLAC
jgi:hypothetical protein